MLGQEKQQRREEEEAEEKTRKTEDTVQVTATAEKKGRQAGELSVTSDEEDEYPRMCDDSEVQETQWLKASMHINTSQETTNLPINRSCATTHRQYT